MDTLKKTLFELTAGELLEILKFSDFTKKEPREIDKKERIVKGRNNLAAELDCSTMSIIKWEKLKIFKPYTQVGRTLFYEVNEVRKALKEHGRLARKI